MGPEIVNTVNEIERLGKQQFRTFVAERFEIKERPIDDPIKKNKLPLFSTANTASSQRTSRTEKKDLKKDVQMFAQLYIATQVRGGTFKISSILKQGKNHHRWLKGEIRGGTKSDLLSCLEIEVESSASEPTVNATALECSVLVNIAKPGQEKTFKGYDENVFYPMIKSEVAKVDRVDVVFDTYRKDSLKATTRKKRGKGIRRKVEAGTQPPNNWNSFLCIEENNVELFRFLSMSVIDIAHPERNTLCAFDEDVICTSNHNLRNVSPCIQEKGDTRVFLHIKDMAENGLRKIQIRTVDTDVIVITLALFERLGLQELSIEFGTGKNKMVIDVGKIHKSIGANKSKALLFFHAFTGCGQVTFFESCKKTKPWNTWTFFPEATETFIVLSQTPTKQRYQILCQR